MDNQELYPKYRVTFSFDGVHFFKTHNYTDSIEEFRSSEIGKKYFECEIKLESFSHK